MAEIERRPIKFRAWDRRTSTMYNTVWPTSLFVYVHSTDLGDGQYANRGINPKHLALMQYTGIDDKNGTPIFEGDIVRNDSWVGAIKYCRSGYDDILAFHPVDKDGHHHHHYYGGWSGNDFEVIGDIFQNGDLLNAKD